jgi:hypothetical protein
MKSAVEGHFVAGLVARHAAEGDMVVVEDQGELLVGFAGEELAGAVAESVDSGAERAGLQAAGAAGAPGAVDELLDQSQLGLGGRLEVGQDGVVKGLELVLFLEGNDKVAAGQAVLDRVEPGAGLAFRGTGAPARPVLGVKCWALGLGHKVPPYFYGKGRVYGVEGREEAK